MSVAALEKKVLKISEKIVKCRQQCEALKEELKGCRVALGEAKKVAKKAAAAPAGAAPKKRRAPRTRAETSAARKASSKSRSMSGGMHGVGDGYDSDEETHLN